MSQAEDLLNSLTKDEVAAYSVDDVTTPHIVINADKSVTIPKELKRILVQHEHNITTVIFDCPRYFGGHDLFEMGMKVVFQRADGHKESHPVENLRVDESDTNMIHFDWTISRNTTLTGGEVRITICGKVANAEGVANREWHTIPNEDLFVNEGMECSEDETVEQYPDVIESILVRLELAEQGGASDEQIAAAVEAYMVDHPIEVPDSGQNPTDEQVAAAIDARLPDIIDGLLDKMNVVGVVDDENNITIYGNLESGTYTLRYEHEDGTTTEIGSLTVVRDDTGEDDSGGETTEKTLTSISAVYSGGPVAVGTAVTALTSVVVTAHYSDSTSEPVTGYTLSGAIVEGNNTITATYQGKTATFTVTGVSGGGGESGSDSNEIPLEFTLGKIDSLTGAITDTTNYAYSNLIEVTEGNKYEIVYTDIFATIKICCYDDSGNFISCSADELADAQTGGVQNQISGSIEVPIVDGAAYFRIRSFLYDYRGSNDASLELLRNGTKLTFAPSEEGAV